MNIFKYDKRNTPPDIPCVLALGFFDGVHLGHRRLIEAASAKGAELGVRHGVLTFPSEAGLKGGAARLTDTDEKLKLIENAGAEIALLCDFDAVANMTPEEFVDRVLISDLNCKVCYAGYNFRFGKNAAGDAETLCRLMADRGAEAVILEEFRIDGNEVSASAVRRCLAEGDPRRAAKLLGRPYSVDGTVERGRSVGTQLGTPTVNTSLDGRVLPRLGVYRTAVIARGKLYTGITNIGICPTFALRTAHAETHILNFNGDLYGEKVQIFLLDFLRDEDKFSDANELKKQIRVDILRINNEFGDVTWQELGQNLP